MIQAVIFDMDGLIFDTEELALKGWEDATKRFGCSVTDEELRETIGCANNGIKERLLLRHGKNFDFDAVYAGVEEFMFREIAQKGTPVKKGAPELLSHLRPRLLRKENTRNATEIFAARRRKAIKIPKGDGTMKFWTIDEILEEEMKTPGFAERFERAGQEIEAEFAAERLHAERAQMFFSRYKKQRNTKRPFALHRTRVRATA